MADYYNTYRRLPQSQTELRQFMTARDGGVDGPDSGLLTEENLQHSLEQMQQVHPEATMEDLKSHLRNKGYRL